MSLIATAYIPHSVTTQPELQTTPCAHRACGQQRRIFTIATASGLPVPVEAVPTGALGVGCHHENMSNESTPEPL
jgi:hypothetical protein